MQTSKVRQLSAATFSNEVRRGVAVVDFWAPWCGPCRMMAPVMDDLADRLDGRAVVAKVNVDDAPELAGRFGISAIPVVVILRDGKEVGRYVGVQPAENLLQAVSKSLTEGE